MKNENSSKKRNSNSLVKYLLSLISFLAIFFGATSDGCSTYQSIKEYILGGNSAHAIEIVPEVDLSEMTFDTIIHPFFELLIPQNWDELSCGNINCVIYKHPIEKSMSVTFWLRPHPENQQVVDSMWYFGCPGNIDIFWRNEDEANKIETYYGYKLHSKNISEEKLKKNSSADFFSLNYSTERINCEKSIFEYENDLINGGEVFKGIMIIYQNEFCCKYMLQCIVEKEKFDQYHPLLNEIASSFTPRVIEPFRCCDYRIFYIN